MSSRLTGVIAAAVLSMAPFAASASGVFGSNIIVNGDAEAGAGSPNGYTQVTVPGFTTTSAFTVVQYAAGGGFPMAGDPGVAAGGNNFFAGGDGTASSSASQSIDISSGASVIDLGTATYDLSALLGGYLTQDDNAVLSISFLDGLGGSLGGASLGPVTEPDRGGATGLLARETTGLVPIGARSIGVDLVMTRLEGSYDDGYADNLSLVLGGVGPTGVPEPASWALMIAGIAGVGGLARARRLATSSLAA